MDEYPVEDSLTNYPVFGPNDWDTINTSDTNSVSRDQKIQSPEEFKKEIENLKAKYGEKQAEYWKH